MIQYDLLRIYFEMFENLVALSVGGDSQTRVDKASFDILHACCSCAGGGGNPVY